MNGELPYVQPLRVSPRNSLAIGPAILWPNLRLPNEGAVEVLGGKAAGALLIHLAESLSSFFFTQRTSSIYPPQDLEPQGNGLELGFRDLGPPQTSKSRDSSSQI